MTLTPIRRRRAAAIVALAASLAVVAAPVAEARAGRGSGGMGSRGSQTYAPPPATQTAPGTAAPIQRSQMQPGAGPGMQAPGQRGRFGGGFMAGLLGAGLLGALIGGGFFGGLGGIASFLGLLLQVGLIVGLVYLAIRFFRRRQEPAVAEAGGHGRSSLDSSGQAPGGPAAGGMMGGGFGGLMGGSTRPQPITIEPKDYEAFERSLDAIQGAYGREDVGTLRHFATPEMVGYFEEELRANAERGLVNRISDVKLLQGDLSEAWREGALDFATVAMRFGLRDELYERATNRLVETGQSEATELWTFVRENGGSWLLSAIQQGR